MIGRVSANLTPAFPALAGSRGRVAFTLYQDKLRTSALNLTGYTAKFTVRGSDGTVHVAADETDGIALGGTAGTIVIDTGTMGTQPNVPAGEHDYLFELRNGSGHIELLMLGTWTWDTDISP